MVLSPSWLIHLPAQEPLPLGLPGHPHLQPPFLKVLLCHPGPGRRAWCLKIPQFPGPAAPAPAGSCLRMDQVPGRGPCWVPLHFHPLFRLMALGGGAYPPHTFSPHTLGHFSVPTLDTHLPPQISLSGYRAVGYCAGGGVGYMGCERSRRCLRKSRR